MDELRKISCSMIFKVLKALSNGPLTIDQLEIACMLDMNYLRAVLSSAIYRQLVEEKSDRYYLTSKGARSAIYILVLYESMNYKKSEYQKVLQNLNTALDVSNSNAAIS